MSPQRCRLAGSSAKPAGPIGKGGRWKQSLVRKMRDGGGRVRARLCGWETMEDANAGSLTGEGRPHTLPCSLPQGKEPQAFLRHCCNALCGAALTVVSLSALSQGLTPGQA